jgi:hypothetical protein
MDEMLRITGGGVHATIVLSESQASLEIATDITRKHGSICLVAAVCPLHAAVIITHQAIAQTVLANLSPMANP